jgi:hypothetical protein
LLVIYGVRWGQKIVSEWASGISSFDIPCCAGAEGMFPPQKGEGMRKVPWSSGSVIRVSPASAQNDRPGDVCSASGEPPVERSAARNSPVIR